MRGVKRASRPMASPYAIREDYDGGQRIPTASAPPPLPQQKKRGPPVAPVRASSSPGGYAARADYDPNRRLIPTASAPPPVREMKKPVRKSPQQPIGPPPGVFGPPMYAPQRGYATVGHYPQPPMHYAPPPPQQAFAMEEPDPDMLGPPPPSIKLMLPDGAMFTADGLQSEGVAVYTDKRMSHLTCSATYILYDLLGDDAAEDVQMLHDADGGEFPEISEALAAMGGEEGALCVAVCQSQGVWGVGVGGQWKKRETIAKLALGIALCERSEKVDEIFASYPDFAEYCQGPGVARKKRKTAPKPVPKAPKIVRPPVVAMPLPTPMQSNGGNLPRDVPLWIKLPEGEEVPPELDGYSPEAVAVSTDGTKRKGLYSGADRALSEMVGDVEAEILFHDDCDWKDFPTVGAALKEISDKEECLCVATCPARMVWAVGVCMKGKSRWQAAKVAIATAIQLQAMANGEDLLNMGDGSAMAEFVNEAQDAMNESGFF